MSNQLIENKEKYKDKEGKSFPIKSIDIGTRHRHDMGDMQSLMESIRHRGMINPVTINPNGLLLCGQRRLIAAKKIGLTHVPVRVMEVTSLDHRLELEKDENMLRKELTPTEVVALCKDLERVERYHDSSIERPYANSQAKIRISDPVVTKVARALGKNKRTLERAIEVVEAAEREPDKYGHLPEKMDRRGSINKAHNELQFRKLEEKIKQSPPVMKGGSYGTILIDPPWPYGNSPQHEGTGQLPYPSMAVEEILKFPVSKYAAQDCVVCLWVTNAHLKYGFIAVNRWGFEYRTMLTWVKNTMGTGVWLRGQTEHLLIASQGNPLINVTNETTVMHAPTRSHSEKPKEAYKLLEKIFPGPRIELFARKSRNGWTTHGTMELQKDNSGTTLELNAVETVSEVQS